MENQVKSTISDVSTQESEEVEQVVFACLVFSASALGELY